MRKTIGFDFEKQLPISGSCGESVIPVSVFIVLANAFLQGVLAGTDVEFIEGCRIKDITTKISHKQKELRFAEFFCGPTWNRTKHLLIMSQLL